jgi:hypothetical protein
VIPKSGIQFVFGIFRICEVESVPINPRSHETGGHEQGPDGREPKRHAAQKQPPAGAFETARQFAVAGVAHHVALQVGLRPRIGKPKARDDQYPPQDGIQS